ncbi:MAG: hypothetical protein IPH44_08885 [Myxococcales bacterium]|nr:hypothetical protein [Myxococcales bacterium]MBK7198664.1 hypothetical protein [Myxococcales bacterium]MBP6571895.1 hypothetical protein [Gemmatimonadales bacterium]
MPLPNAPQAACLGDRGDALFACGANWEPDFFSLGRSADAIAWNKDFRFVEMMGPLACPAGTVQRDQCEAVLWPAIREQFGIPTPDGERVDAPGPPSDPRGCCGVGAGGAGFGALGLGVLLVLCRRRSGSDAFCPSRSDDTSNTEAEADSMPATSTTTLTPRGERRR